MQFDDKQQQAIAACCNPARRVVAISGEAGTGKTTIMKAAHTQLTQAKQRVVLAAPTGKAARRITEATGIHAITVHKLLKYSRPEVDLETGEAKGATVPGYGKSKRMPFDVVIVDEYAMVNEELHRNLLDALEDGARLCAFGDINQLPPIEQYVLARTDTPFERILRLPGGIQLDQVYRQAEGSPILVNAHRIKKKQMPVRRPGFDIRITFDHVDNLLKYVQEQQNAGTDFRRIEHQIITPSTKTWIGTRALNQALQAIYIDLDSPDIDAIKLPRFKWEKEYTVFVHLGEKVICTENSYDLRDYRERFSFIDPDRDVGLDSNFIEPPPTAQMLNGETGVVTALHDDGSFEVDFGDRIVRIPPYYLELYNHDGQRFMIKIDPRKRIDLAYAITTHKAQGSEFESVIYIMGKSTWYNSNRNNFYTAVTRARNKFCLITDVDSLQDALRMDSKEKEKLTEAYRKQNAGLKAAANAQRKGASV